MRNNFRHLYPFRSHYANLNGLKYHYLDEGEGDPVVMLHGNPTWSFFYRNLVMALSPEFRAIAPDHIGCGLSDKPDPDHYDYRLMSRVANLEYLLNHHLDLKQRITLVLHDWGGMIGLLYALRHTRKIRGIVVMNTSGFLPPGEKQIPLRLRLIRNVGSFAVPAVLGLNLFARAALFMASSKGLSNDVKAGLIWPYNSRKNRIATLRFVQDIPLKKGDPSYALVKYADDNLSQLAHIPMLICWGMKDFVFDKEYLTEWRKRFPHAEAHEFHEAGHYVLEDAAHEIIPLIRDFLVTKHPNTK